LGAAVTAIGLGSARPVSWGRRLARSLGLGRAALALYHRPVGLARKSVAEGGPLEQWRTEQGRRAMVQAAAILPPITAPPSDRGARVAFLSGAAHWYQTLFCFASLQAHIPERITPVIFEDGTMTAEARAGMRRAVPWTEIVGAGEIEERLDRCLPFASFPWLRARRLEYPHLRKLIDIHLTEADWTLVMDSDMLFFRCPHALLSWFGSPHAMSIQDALDAYGYSPALMSELAGGHLPKRINVGLYALRSPSIDWDRLEYWCRTQIEREGPHYLQEQALTALLLAGAGAEALPEADYVVLPSLAEGRSPTAVLHHYVAHSKRSYFQHGWRHVLACLQQQA
jgi:hypothetical protein